MEESISNKHKSKVKIIKKYFKKLLCLSKINHVAHTKNQCLEKNKELSNDSIGLVLNKDLNIKYNKKK